MKKNKSVKDTISENEYTMRMKSVSARPEDDSPGDSETDAGAEFEMGLEYMADDRSDLDISGKEEPKYPVPQISSDATVVSSEQPAPWMDRNSSSSTN